jgi:hypothetical protein
LLSKRELDLKRKSVLPKLNGFARLKKLKDKE